MEELEGSQMVQQELHASLEAALERLNQLDGEMQEVGERGRGGDGWGRKWMNEA